jgi:hypothetical protein
MLSSGAFGVFAGTSADGNVTKSTSLCPVAATTLTEMARLRVVVVVIVTELSVG